MFNSWIKTIACASIIISVFEIVFPVGKMGRFTKNLFGIFYAYVVLIPLINFLNCYI